MGKQWGYKDVCAGDVTLLDGSNSGRATGRECWMETVVLRGRACWTGTQWSRYWTGVLVGETVVGFWMGVLDRDTVVALLDGSA